MAKPWREVAQSSTFKSLNPEQQDAARAQYFNDVIAPQVPTHDIEAARNQFFADTTPGTLDKAADFAKRGVKAIGDTLAGHLAAPDTRMAELDAQSAGSGQPTPPAPPANDMQPAMEVQAESVMPEDPRSRVQQVGFGQASREARAAQDAPPELKPSPMKNDADNIIQGLVTGLKTDIGQAGGAIFRAAGKGTGNESLEEAGKFLWDKYSKQAQRDQPELESTLGRGLYSGARSFETMLASIIVGGGNPTATLAAMVGPMAAQETGKALEAGKDLPTAIAYGVGQGGLEWVTEKMPLGFLLKNVGKGGFKQFIGGYLLRELPSESAATITQKALEQATLHPEKTWAEYAKELPQDLAETAIATGVMTAGAGALHQGAKGLRPSDERSADLEREQARQQAAAQSLAAPATAPQPQGAPQDAPPVGDAGAGNSGGDSVAGRGVPVSDLLGQPEDDGSGLADGSAAAAGTGAADVAPGAVAGGSVANPALTQGAQPTTTAPLAQAPATMPPPLTASPETLARLGEIDARLQAIAEDAPKRTAPVRASLEREAAKLAKEKADAIAAEQAAAASQVPADPVAPAEVPAAAGADAVAQGAEVSGEVAAPEESPPIGAGVMAVREQAGRDKFVSSAVEQFGLTQDEARAALDTLIKEKVVKIDAVGGQYSLKDGRFWDGDVLRRAANQKPATGKQSLPVQSAPKPKNLLKLIQQGGGISLARLADITGEKNVRRARTPVGLFRKSGMDIDGLAELLQQHGFLTEQDVADVGSGGEQAMELVRKALAGDRVLSQGDQEAAFDQDAEKQYRSMIREKADKLGIRHVARKFEDIEADVLAADKPLEEDLSEFDLARAGYTEASEGAQNVVDAFDAFEAVGQRMSTRDSMRAMGFTEEEINAELNGPQDRAEEGAGSAGEGVARGPQGSSANPAEAGSNQEGAQEGFQLEAPTPEGLRAQAEAAQQAADAEAKRQKEAEDKKRAEDERAEIKRRSEAAADSFVLGGDAMDNLTGQGSVFDAPAEPVSAQKQPVDRASDEARYREILSKWGSKAYGKRWKPSTPTEIKVEAEALRERLTDQNPVKKSPPAVSANTIFTDEAADAARARLRAKLGRLNAGIDPEMLMDGITVAGNHIEKGARTFAAYAKAMIEDLGEGVRPFLKSWYMGVKYDPRSAGFEGMSSASEVDAFANDADFNETAPDGVPVVPGFPGNGPQRGSTKEHGLQSLNIDLQRGVLAKMVDILQDDKILKSVVEAVPVGVMNVLIGRKISSDELLNNPSVLRGALSVPLDGPVPSGVLDFLDAILAVRNSPALPAAITGPLSDVVDRALEVGAAGTADHGNHVAPRDVGAEIVPPAKLDAGGTDNESDQRGGADLERDREDADTQDGVGAQGVRAGRGGDGGARGSGVQGDAGAVAPAGGSGVRGSEAAPAGEGSDQSIHRGAPEHGPGSAGSRIDLGSRDSGIAGPPVEPPGTAAVEQAAAGRSERLKDQQRQQEADATPLDESLQNVRDTLPALHEGQQEDVYKAEQRFAKPDGYGMLFTNGTGTGKTFTGLGVAKRFTLKGKSNILIVAPNDKIIEDWIKSGKVLGLDITPLADTKDAGKGVVITTYANMGQNPALASRNWDLVVHDEAHYLSMDKEGTVTLTLKALRAISLHPDGAHERAMMLHGDLYRAAAERAKDAKQARMSDDERDWHKAEGIQKEADALHRKWQDAKDAVTAHVAENQGEKRPRVLMLSATPFAYEKSVELANGYLFDYNEGQSDESREFRGYNSGSNKDRFFVQHFGYRIRYGKLTQPDAKVDSGLMQRQFNSWLKKRGALSGRMLDVAADYDRKFILTDSAIGARIDEALNWFDTQRAATSKERNGNRFAPATPRESALGMLRDKIYERFDHLARRYLLEAIKAREVIPHVREHLALGRKVVIFHDYKKGGGFNPFRLNPAGGGETDDQKARSAAYNKVLGEFQSEFRDLIDNDIWSAGSPITEIQKAFPGALVFNGDVPKKKRRELVAKFQDDASGPQVFLVQSAAGKEGISLHDTTGKHQRVLFNLGLPTQPTTTIQQEGRIYRTGQVTDAIFRYLNTGTNWERWAFATTIATRASAAENLGMGELSRALKDAFIAGFEESDNYRAGMEGEGTGGKARDRAANEALTEFDRARAFYFGTQKKNSKTKAQEGKDYFATPEPVGLKMMQWANIRPGERVLEPSAGHGAIARWAPEDAERTAIEPSAALRSRLAMVFDGKIEDGTFEDLNVVNKYDAIVMNPPFGVGGKTAIEHLAKAATHLRPGGRIVALIPTGPAADKRFDKWFYEEETRPLSPLLEHPKLGPLYVGDKVTTRASFAKEGVLTRKDRSGSIYLKTAPGSETLITAESITGAEPTGARTKQVSQAEGLHLVTRMSLPQVTFERAGTSVATRIVVIEKQVDKDTVPKTYGFDLDLSNIGDINELFERIEPLEIPERVKVAGAAPAEQAAKPAAPAVDREAAAAVAAEKGLEIVEHTTQRGKVIRGVVRSDLTREQAKEIDEFTFKKDGGWFIREKHLVDENGNAKFDRRHNAPHKTIHEEDLAAVAAAFRSAYPGYAVSVLESDALAPKGLLAEIAAAGAQGDVAGAFHEGTIYLFRSGIATVAEAEHTALHEGTHAGFAALFGADAKAAMMDIWLKNGSVRKKADALSKKYGYSHVRATEEVMADMGGDMVSLKGFDRLVAAVRAWLRKHGFVSEWTDNDIAGLVMTAREYGRKPRRASVFGRGMLARTQWSENFPDAEILYRAEVVQAHPDYRAAKDGDAEAAERLIADIVTDQDIERLRPLVGDADALVVAVHAEEAAGKNKIPMAYAARIADDLGKRLDMRIVQAKKVGRGGSDGIHRLATDVPFVGEVEEGSAYLLVDDTLTQGGTLADLKGYIEENGGQVVGATTLMGKQYSATLKPSSAMLEQLRAKYGQDFEKWWASEFGYGFDRLTESEARYLVKARGTDADALRNRILAARQGRDGGVDAGQDAGAQAGEGSQDDVARFARRGQAPVSPALASARKKVGLIPRQPFKARVKAHLATFFDALKNRRNDYIDAFRQGSLDQFYGILKAERASMGNLPAEQSAYVAARLATGASSVMRAILMHGAPKWAANGQHLEKIDGTEGLLDILKPVAEELDDWIGWMVGNRAARLKREGRENLLNQPEIAALRAVADTPEKAARFREAARKFAAFKRTILDVAEQAGLIDATTRPAWDNADWIPFNRVREESGDVIGPRGKRGLEGQRNNIRTLTGGEASLNDPLENIIMNFQQLLDASLKNNAVRKAVAINPALVEEVGYQMSGALVPAGQVEKQLKAAGVPEAIMATIPPEAFEGIRKMWAITPPTDPDVIRVMVDGKPQFYRVLEPLLLRAVTSFQPFDFPGLGAARAFRRVLTATVTATPEFMLRNFIRDTASTAVISRNPVAATGAFKGVLKALKESGAAEQMMFAGASFAGGHVAGHDVEDTARAIRRSLRNSGLSAADIDSFLGSVVDTTAKYWDKYRRIGDAIENANREAVFEGVTKDGGTATQAAFEAKDLMDFSLRGSWAGYQVLADILPFFNARVQGLYRLSRTNPKQMAIRGSLLLTLPTMILALMNADDDEYQALPDWQKDSYWFINAGDAGRFFIPKPFEVGVIFGSIPERAFMATVGDDDAKKFARRTGWMLAEQLNLFSMPQIIAPAAEAFFNYDLFRGRPIETMADENRLPHDRYDERTSTTMKHFVGAMGGVADTFRISPKKVQHLIEGYFGTMGAWALAATDIMITNQIAKEAPRADWRIDDFPVIRAFYKNGPPKSTQHVQDIYDLARQWRETKGSIKSKFAQGLPEQGRDDMKDYARMMAVGPIAEGYAGALSESGKELRRVQRDWTIGGAEKRRKLDELYAKRAEISARGMARIKAKEKALP